MIVGIPVFGNRVSPRFDGAPALLLVDVSNGDVTPNKERSMIDARGWQSAEFLKSRRVEVLLCGGIRRCDYFSILDSGIEVYPGLMGEVDEILDTFLRGELTRGDLCGHAESPRSQRRRCRGRVR